MSFKIKWNKNFNNKEYLSFMFVGPAPDCLQITKQVKILLDERYKNKKSLLHCCEDLNDLVDEVDILIDFIVILIDNQTSKTHILNTIKWIDPRYILNSRLIFVRLMNYSKNLNSELLLFINQLCKEYDSISLIGSTEEPEFVIDISQSIAQYAFYIFNKKFVNVYTNENRNPEKI